MVTWQAPDGQRYEMVITGSAEVIPGEPVPDGPADQVLAWVAEDWVKAGRALDVENARTDPRPELVAALGQLLVKGQRR